jgi:ABC-type taurine transport system ATPase subunit
LESLTYEKLDYFMQHVRKYGPSARQILEFTKNRAMPNMNVQDNDVYFCLTPL